MKFRIHAAACAAFLLASVQAFAHHPGTGGGSGAAGPITTIPATTLEAGQTAISFLYEFIKFNSLSDAKLNASVQPDGHLHTIDSIQSPSLSFARGITDNLTVAIRVPYVMRDGINEVHRHGMGAPHLEHFGSSNGFGDVTLFAQYRFLNDKVNNAEAAVILGVKTPTGATGAKTNTGDTFSTEFQPGSGSWDGLFGLAFTKGAGPWSFSTNILFTAAGKGAQDVNLGNQFRYNAGLSYRVSGYTAPTTAVRRVETHTHADGHRHQHVHEETVKAKQGPAIDLILEAVGEWHGKQRGGDHGGADPNSGGNVVYLSPGIRFSNGNGASTFVSLGVPVLKDMNGIQADPKWRLVTGGAVSF